MRLMISSVLILVQDLGCPSPCPGPRREPAPHPRGISNLNAAPPPGHARASQGGTVPLIRVTKAARKPSPARPPLRSRPCRCRPPSPLPPKGSPLPARPARAASPAPMPQSATTMWRSRRRRSPRHPPRIEIVFPLLHLLLLHPRLLLHLLHLLVGRRRRRCRPVASRSQGGRVHPRPGPKGWAGPSLARSGPRWAGWPAQASRRHS